MKNTKEKTSDNSNQSIFFTILFLITATVSLVLYAINFEHLSLTVKIIWFVAQLIVLLRSYFILKRLYNEEVDS